MRRRRGAMPQRVALRTGSISLDVGAQRAGSHGASTTWLFSASNRSAISNVVHIRRAAHQLERYVRPRRGGTVELKGVSQRQALRPDIDQSNHRRGVMSARVAGIHVVLAAAPG
jgi:hypothetical protein